MSPVVTAPEQLRVRPVVATRLAVVLAVLLFGLFLTIALVMTRESAGVQFRPVDRVATGVIGAFAAAGALLLARPRLVADHVALRTKAWAGTYRTIPWELVEQVQFPPGRRFARVVLPGEEYLALYAVQRLDGERTVRTMAQLRALHAAVRAERDGSGAAEDAGRGGDDRDVARGDGPAA